MSIDIYINQCKKGESSAHSYKELNKSTLGEYEFTYVRYFAMACEAKELEQQQDLAEKFGKDNKIGII